MLDFYLTGNSDVDGDRSSVRHLLGTNPSEQSAGRSEGHQRPTRGIPEADANGLPSDVVRQQLCQSDRLRHHVQKLPRQFEKCSKVLQLAADLPNVRLQH